MILKGKVRVVDGKGKCHCQCVYWDDCMGWLNLHGICPQWTLMTVKKSIVEINNQRRVEDGKRKD